VQINLISFGTLDKDENDEQVVKRRWYTSADEFKPLSYRFYSGGYKETYYAWSLKTKEYLVVKKLIRGEGRLPG